MNRYEVKVVDDNVESILSEAISQYEKRTGKILQPAHIERLLINVYAMREKELMKRFVRHFRNLQQVLRWIYVVRRLVVTDYLSAQRALFCVLALTVNIRQWLFQKAHVFQSLMTLNLSR